jgi:hypothetical protein
MKLEPRWPHKRRGEIKGLKTRDHRPCKARRGGEKRWGLPNARSNRIGAKQASERESEAQEHVCLPCCPQRLLLRHIISPAMMDLDPPSPSTPQNPHHNAVAGPSSIPLDSSLFLLPPGPYHFLFNLNQLSISPLFYQPLLALPSFSRAHKTSSLDSIS